MITHANISKPFRWDLIMITCQKKIVNNSARLRLHRISYTYSKQNISKTVFTSLEGQFCSLRAQN